jgi:hypothetical protein
MIVILRRLARALRRWHEDRVTRAALDRLDEHSRRDFELLVRRHKDAAEAAEFNSKHRSAGASRRGHIAAMTPTTHP